LTRKIVFGCKKPQESLNMTHRAAQVQRKTGAAGPSGLCGKVQPFPAVQRRSLRNRAHQWGAGYAPDTENKRTQYQMKPDEAAGRGFRQFGKVNPVTRQMEPAETDGGPPSPGSTSWRSSTFSTLQGRIFLRLHRKKTGLSRQP
jgi:hypothetical protein